MRSPVVQKLLDEMKKDSWWVKLKREIRLKLWVWKCRTRKYWDKDFINRRDYITNWSIRPGTILKVFPASRSHVKKPYTVLVIESNKKGFTTELTNAFCRGHKTEFRYDSIEWETYHHTRFQIQKF